MAKTKNPGGVEGRVYAHYKSLKLASPLQFVETKRCGWLSPCDYLPHRHGYMGTSTSNNIWMVLARRHKMPVRQVKDIITKLRKS